jgi:hypothetical protein
MSNSDRDLFFGECTTDYADAMTALATFQGWAAGLCEAALRKCADEFIAFKGRRPAAFETYNRPEEPCAIKQFRCGAWARSRGNNGPNVVCWLLWSHQPNEEGFQRGIEVSIWLRNRQRAKDLYDVIQGAKMPGVSDAWEVDSSPLGGPTFRRYPESQTTSSVETQLRKLLLDVNTLLKGINGIAEFLGPGPIYWNQPRLEAIYKVLEDGAPHTLAGMLDEAPIKNLPEKKSVDNIASLKKLLKRHEAKGRKEGLWDCSVVDGMAKMTFPPGNQP